MLFKRVFLIVLDSLGIGAMQDAESYGDAGSNTLASVSQSELLNIPNLRELGIYNIDDVGCGKPAPRPYASFARMTEQSKGKDTTIGHWEIAGLITPQAFPVYPNGFPQKLLNELSKQINRKILCNKPMSGTEAISVYGSEHVKSGAIIVYTSADSVFQIAAHESVVPVEELYEICERARKILCGEHAVARVIARPFTGESGNYVRTSARRDFSVEPTEKTMLDYISEAGLECVGVGKINDIFAGKGITRTIPTHSNAEGMREAISLARRDFGGLVFVNLVDFDMLYGHRNDVDGYARSLSEFDNYMSQLLCEMTSKDVLIITADHGCDPKTPSTDHSREYTPMLVIGDALKRGVNLGTRSTFADIAATVAEYLGVEADIAGESFLQEVINK